MIRRTVLIRRTLGAFAVVLTMGAATGCGITVENVPMPKPGIGGPGYTIRAAFR
ncbi:mammalian cell entry protein, partial [Nocardia cyriacigeorgica]|nr:mammalian cell entry protein [Nocardia cyriacigeorgica]